MRRLVILALVLVALAWLAGCSSDDEPHVPTVPPGSGETPQEPGTTYWWNDQVFYEVFVRSFADSDGDGNGDLQGLIARLDYLNDGNPDTDTDLGVTALWLMPIAQSPSYHGYDTTDYQTIESDYGTNADFQQLVGEAHARGMKIIVDYVMNHCSNQHPWFTASAAGDPTYADWFLWRGDNPGWTQPWGGGPVWHDGGSRGYYYGVFWSGMPDLNYTNPAVVQEMTDIADFWLQDMGADGFRLDAIKYLVEDGSTLEDTPATLAFWTDFSQQIAASHPEAYLVGEVYDETGIVLQYIDAGLQTCFDFDLAEGMIAAANAGSPGAVIAQLRQLVNLFPYHQYATFLTNHDQRRLYSQLGNNVGRNKVAAAMLLTLPGVPFLYYGEEVGMQSAWSPDEDKRRPMQWTAGANAGFTSGSPWYAVGSNYATNNVAVMRADENSLWNHYRTLVQTRARSTTLQRGTYHRLDVSNGALFAFLRHHEGDGVVAVHNLASGTIGGFSLSVPASQLAPGTYTAQDLVTGADLTGLTVGADGSIGDWRPTGFILGQSYLLVQLTSERRE